MTSDVQPDSYHHGDLPNALRRAAAEVIQERGVGAFSLREVARRAGVSHTAPAHHFGDMRGLLTSLAVEGFNALRQATIEATEKTDDPAERLAAIGTAYVALAQSNNAHCQVMYRLDIIDADDPALMESSMSAFSVLEDSVQNIVEAEGLAVDINHATWLCWSAMQGLISLGPKLDRVSMIKRGKPISTPETVAEFTNLILNGIRGST